MVEVAADDVLWFRFFFFSLQFTSNGQRSMDFIWMGICDGNTRVWDLNGVFE